MARGRNKNIRQYQVSAFVPVITAAAVAAVALSSTAVFYSTKTQYQAKTEPVFVPAPAISYLPWSEPVRVKRISTAQIASGCVYVPQDQPGRNEAPPALATVDIFYPNWHQ